ncbi:toprim domain-containing protein [Xanthobacter autotrophicus]|uniref:DUF7146 domain-containing protein n=2 Tax=Xanthobacter autotrophicus TaxID=280 RepID=UPI001E2A4873|nr:toprim domain-containing protein [Xanthobacter autotrophicus]UDQ88654.1 toprim domain-containing protein [Xanthobacter autotrophicus]
MADAAHDLARRLGRQAEAVCRHYLSAGRRQGHYWQVGDVRNTPGRSMFVRLRDSAKGPAGKWTDAATGEHGDLLDLIRESRGLSSFSEVVAEAEMFLRIPRSVHEAQAPLCKTENSSRDPVISARRLFAAAQSIPGTIVETYLRNRGITALHETGSLRFHPRCYYRSDAHTPIQPLPAMVAAVTDLSGRIRGVHRTWLAPNGSDKAAITTPRRAMGHLLEHAVRFGGADDVMAVGEGIETILSVRTLLPNLPMAAALSAAHLAVIAFPPGLRRLYIVRDNDPAGYRARDSVASRAASVGIEAIVLSPALGDFNEDLRAFGVDAVRAELRCLLAPEDVSRFTMLNP